MFSRLLVLAAFAAVLIAPSAATAQGTFTWHFGTLIGGPTAASTSSTGSGATAGNFSIGNSFGTVSPSITTFNFVGSASGAYNIGNAVDNTFTTFNTAAPYFEVTLNNSLPGGLVLNGFSFFYIHGSTGAVNYSLRASNDGYVADLLSATVGTANTWLPQTNSPVPTNLGTGAVTLRLFVFNGTSGATSGDINTQIDDVVISYSPVPEPATMLGLSALGLGALGLVRRIRREAVAVS